MTAPPLVDDPQDARDDAIPCPKLQARLNAEKARGLSPLVLRVIGVCTEPIKITRSNLTLRGESATIRAAKRATIAAALGRQAGHDW